MSKANFSANTELWRKSRNLVESTFQRDVLNNVGSIFEMKPISPVSEEAGTAEDNFFEEVELIDASSLEAASSETGSLTPDEVLVSFTESEYESLLKEKSAEIELRVREELETEFKGELGRLSSRQSDFFEAIIDAVRSDNLTAEIVSISLKIGSFLARSQLKFDESVISDFVTSTLSDLDPRSSEDISVQVSRDWEGYLTVIEGDKERDVKIIYEDTLGPGDIIITAGNSGCLDLLQERIDNIEDQLLSTQPLDEVDSFVELLRRSFSEVEIGDASDTDLAAYADRSADNSQYPDTGIADFDEETVAAVAKSEPVIKTTTAKEKASDE